MGLAVSAIQVCFDPGLLPAQDCEIALHRMTAELDKEDKMRHRHRGFTLVESLVVLMILGLIGVAIMGFFPFAA